MYLRYRALGSRVRVNVCVRAAMRRVGNKEKSGVYARVHARGNGEKQYRKSLKFQELNCNIFHTLTGNGGGVDDSLCES